MIVRAVDGLPQDTRNAGRLSYRLNYMAQLQNTDNLPAGTDPVRILMRFAGGLTRYG